MSTLPSLKELRTARQDAARKRYFGPALLGALLRGQARRKQKQRRNNAPPAATTP